MAGFLAALALTTFGVAEAATAPVSKATTTATAKTTAAKKPAPKVDNKQKMIVETLPMFVRIYGKNPTNAEKAWWRKRISCGEMKSLAALEKSMNYHKGKGVSQGSKYICGLKAAPAAAGVVTRQMDKLSDHPQGDEVRIGIWHTDGKAIVVTANGEFMVRDSSGDTLATLGKDDEVKVSWSGGLYHVRGSGLEIDTKEVIRLVPKNSNIIMKIVNYSDPSATYPGKNYNRFRGIIEIRRSAKHSELWAINQLRTELYLRGLGETSGQGPEEYIKALGIAARTYVLYHKIVTGGRDEARGYDITNTADDQIYRGYEYEIITPRMASIFNKVRGIVVANSEGDKLVSTIYFSDSDGRTRTAKEVWGTDRFPQLQKSVKDPYHAASKCLGHCVGMSAQGAYGFASKESWSYQKILNYYYAAIKLVKAY